MYGADKIKRIKNHTKSEALPNKKKCKYSIVVAL